VLGPHPANEFLRRLPPLIAVMVLLGPSTAFAAGSSPKALAPDSPPAQVLTAVGGPTPDPAPSAAHRAAPVSAPLAKVLPAAALPPASLTQAPSPAAPKRQRRAAHAAPRAHTASVRIADVMPFAVDVHPNLGAVAAPFLDESTLVLAAIALLAAVAVAGSGAALVLTSRELL
jgi:hypothetical protein